MVRWKKYIIENFVNHYEIFIFKFGLEFFRYSSIIKSVINMVYKTKINTHSLLAKRAECIIEAEPVVPVQLSDVSV